MAARMNNNPEAFTTVGDAGGNDSFLEMQKYFGPMSRADIETHAADKFAHTTHNLPRSYVGRNLFLQSTIDFLLTKTDDWYTRVMLPWFETDELHVEWQVWRFNKTIFELEVCCAGVAFVAFSVAIKNPASHAPCAPRPRFFCPLLSPTKACRATLRKSPSSTPTPSCAADWYVLLSAKHCAIRVMLIYANAVSTALFVFDRPSSSSTGSGRCVAVLCCRLVVVFLSHRLTALSLLLCFFVQTELGKQHYFMNIKQIVDAIHTTAYLGVMHALLGCYSERRLWQLRHGSLAPQTVADIMMDERNSWALCQKDIKGLYVMDAELRDRLKRQGVEVR